MTDFHEDIWVKFSRYDNENAHGFYARVKCSICRRWNIDILPEGTATKFQRHYRPLDKTIAGLIPYLSRPICGSCDAGLSTEKRRENLSEEMK